MSLSLNSALRSLSFLILSLVVLYYYKAVIDIDYIHTQLLDLGPEPDGQEYLAGSVSIIRSGKFGITIGEDFLPSRYPFGYSLFLIPIIYVLGQQNSIFAPYFLNSLIGLLILFGFFFFYFISKRYLAAIVSILLLVTLPSFIILSRSSMSENTSLLITLMIFLMIFIAQKTNKYFPIFIASLMLGLSTTIRLDMIFFVPILFLSILTIKTNKRLALNQFLITCSLFLLGLFPLFIYQYVMFGNPLRTGYHFWVPFYYEQGSFHIKYLTFQITSIFKELLLVPDNYRVANLFGTGVYITPFFILLFLFSIPSFFIVPLKKENFLNLFPYISSILLFVVGHLFYFFYQDIRFYYPVFILMIIPITRMMEISFCHIFKLRFFNQKFFSTLILIGLFICVLVGFPSTEGYPKSFTFSQTLALLNKQYLGDSSPVYLATKELESYQLAGRVLVLTKFNPVFISMLLPQNFIVIPQDKDHIYAQSKVWRFNEHNRNLYILKALKNNWKIVYLGPSKITVNEINNTIDLSQNNYSWSPLGTSSKTSIFKLNF